MSARAARDCGVPFDPAKWLPEAWIPCKPSNPTKLTLHVLADGVWHRTAFSKFARAEPPDAA